MKKVLDIFKKPLWLLCLGLGIVLLFSVLANMANTSAYHVSVTEVSFKTERGQLTGLLYRPKTCTDEKPCATIVTTHGYLNTKEMQDAPAIEMSKRGYVVLALDMYAHGDSYWDASENEVSGMEFSGWSVWDAVEYMYEQKYVLKAADGTGIIAVSGHSMGGFSTRLATGLDNDSIAAGNPQKIVAALPVGADFTFSSLSDVVGSPAKWSFQLISGDVANKRTVGTIAAKYDEFFFCEGFACGSGYVAAKDWTLTTDGTQFYYGDPTLTEASLDFKAGEWNTTSYNGGGSVIYTPNELHPWDHFSVETTGYMVDFYDHAFKTQIELHGVTETQGVTSYGETKAQSWWVKEGFECIALIGMFIAIAAAIGTFAALPFFSKVTTAETEINEVKTPTGGRKCLLACFAALTTFALAYLYPSLLGVTPAFGGQSGAAIDPATNTTAYNISMGGTSGLEMWYGNVLLWIVRVGAVAIVALLVARVILTYSGKENEEGNKKISSVIASTIGIVAASLFSYWAIHYNLFGNAHFYNEEMTNIIARWAFACSGLTVLSVLIAHVLNNKKDGYTLANYGLKANWKQVLVALLIAVITVGGVYVLTFAIEALLRVDFRIWTYAIKPFGWPHFVAFLKYLPFFFAFYLANAISVVANTGTDKTWKGTLKAVLLNICGVVFILALQYGKDFATGTAEWPTAGLNILLLFAIVPTLAVAAWLARKSYFKTGNIWTAVFINTLLFTMLQVANTILHTYGSILVVR